MKIIFILTPGQSGSVWLARTIGQMCSGAKAVHEPHVYADWGIALAYWQGRLEAIDAAWAEQQSDVERRLAFIEELGTEWAGMPWKQPARTHVAELVAGIAKEAAEAAAERENVT